MATPIPAKAVLEFTPRPRTLPRFEDMVRALARPAPAATLPPQTPPTAQETEHLVAVCAVHGITFVGPPID